MIARSIQTAAHGRFLVEPPATGVGARRLLVGFHGYGENAERHLDQLRAIPAVDRWTLVSVQGLNRFYAGRFEEVVASWMTRQDREQAIADNLAYVDRVLAALAGELGAPSRLVFAGFSQGAAMAYRAAMFGAARADGVIALGGDVPPDVCEQQRPPAPRVLVGRGTLDAWYTGEKLQADLAYLQGAGSAVESVVFEGGHQWSGEFRVAAGRFLQAIDALPPPLLTKP